MSNAADDRACLYGSNFTADVRDVPPSLPPGWSWIKPEREPPTHKPDRAARVECWVGGSLVRVSRLKAGGPRERKGGGVRQPITVFSRDSRRRLMRRLAQTRRGCIPMFVTLTYPDHFPPDPRRWKRDRDTFGKRLKRAFPKSSFVWRLHTQERKSGDNAGEIAPHYHLLIWGAGYADLRAFVPVAWYEVVGSGDEKHLRAGTRVEMPHSFRGVMRYVSNELAKLEQATVVEGVGRWWGFHARALVPWAELVWWNVQDGDVVRFMRWLRRFACRVSSEGKIRPLKARAYKSLAVFGDGSFWCNKLRGPPGGDFLTWSRNVASYQST